MALQVGDEMKGQTTNEVRAKIPGGNHCDQDLLDALDEIDRKNDAMGSMIREIYELKARIDAMQTEVDKMFGEMWQNSNEPNDVYIRAHLKAIREAGKGNHDADAERGVV